MHAANIVVNGGFETSPALPNDGDNPGSSGDRWGIFPNVTGWSATNEIEIWSGNWGSAGQYGPYEGNQIAELDPNRNTEIFQVLTTVPGQQYYISFVERRRHDDPSGVSSVIVSWGGVDVLTNTTTSTAWIPAGVVVTATGTSTELRFKANGPSNSYGDHIDAVSVDGVPEPSTALLGLGGMALIAAFRRKLRKQ